MKIICLNELIKNMKKDHISEYSAQGAYYVILSLIPFIIILITIIQYANINQKAVIEIIINFVPENMKEFVQNIIQEIYSKSIGTISISLIFTLWSAGKGLYALYKGFYAIYGINSKKETNYFYLRFKAIIQIFLFIISIIIALGFLVFGNNIIEMIHEHFNIFERFDVISKITAKIGIGFITFIIFLMMYKFMINKKVKLKTQILGAFISSIILNIISFGFSMYLDIFKDSSVTYGGITALTLIMIWSYICFYTIFLGAEINKIMNEKILQ